MNKLETVLRAKLELYHKRGNDVSYTMSDCGYSAEVAFKVTGKAVAIATVISCNEEYISQVLHKLSVLIDMYVAALVSNSADTPPWAEEEAAKLTKRADSLSKGAAALNEKLDDSMGSDLKVFAAMGKAARGSAGATIVPRLIGDWRRHTEWHYSVDALGGRIDFWPSTCKAQVSRGHEKGPVVTGARSVSQLLTKCGVMK